MFFYIFVFLLGSVFGSFVSMASHRLTFDKPISLLGRSHCTKCKKTLNIKSLVPIFSFLCQRGKCAFCKKEIAFKYITIELVTGGLFVFTAFFTEGDLILMSLINLYVVAMMVLIVTDFEKLIIPDQVQIAIAVIGIFFAFYSKYSLVNVLIMPIFMFVFSVLLKYGFYLYKKQEGLGNGDIKFFAASGLYLTPEMVSPFFLLSGLMGVMTAMFWCYIGKGKVFPFGPALSIALYIVILLF